MYDPFSLKSYINEWELMEAECYRLVREIRKLFLPFHGICWHQEKYRMPHPLNFKDIYILIEMHFVKY